MTVQATGSWWCVLRINLSFGPHWQTSSSQVMSSYWPSHLLRSSGRGGGCGPIKQERAVRFYWAQSVGQSQFNKNECGDRWGLLLMRDADGGNCRGKCWQWCGGTGWSRLKETPNKMCFDGGPLFVLSWPLCPAFITASGGKQMGHNKSLTIKRRVWN